MFEDLSDLYDVREKYERSMHYGLQACAVLGKHLPGSFNDFAVPLRKLIMLSKRLPQPHPRRIGELLTESGILSRDELQVALQLAKQTAKPLGSVLRNDRLVDELDLQSVLSVQLLVKQKILTDAIAIEILKVRDWLLTISRSVSQRFATVLNQELKTLCKACAVNLPTQPHRLLTVRRSSIV